MLTDPRAGPERLRCVCQSSAQAGSESCGQQRWLRKTLQDRRNLNWAQRVPGMRLRTTGRLYNPH